MKYSTEAPTSAAPPASPGLTGSLRKATADRKPNTGIRFSTIAAQPPGLPDGPVEQQEAQPVTGHPDQDRGQPEPGRHAGRRRLGPGRQPGDARVRSGGWQSTVGRDLAGRTLGLLGLGRIGQRVAGYGRAFGMDVLAWSQNLTADRAESCGARLVGKASLFRESDVVSVHVQLSDRTRGLVGAAELALLGPGGYLVNTSRGPIVDEAALLAALQGGMIAGAALDVFGTEPLPAGHPLRSAPRTVLTPHLGYVTDRGYEVFFADTVEDIVAWLDGVPVRVLSPGPAT